MPSRQHPRNDFHSNAGADKGVDTSASLSMDTAGVGLAEHDLCDAPSFFDQSQPAVFLHFRFLSDPQFSLALQSCEIVDSIRAPENIVSWEVRRLEGVMMIVYGLISER